MHCTIFEPTASTVPSDDASASYYRFRRNARTLGAFSRSFEALAADTTAAYEAALAQPTIDAWTTLIARTAAFTAEARALDAIVHFDARERESLAFFEAIVDENADLLDATASASMLDAFGVAARGDNSGRRAQPECIPA